MLAVTEAPLFDDFACCGWFMTRYEDRQQIDANTEIITIPSAIRSGCGCSLPCGPALLSFLSPLFGRRVCLFPSSLPSDVGSCLSARQSRAVSLNGGKLTRARSWICPRNWCHVFALNRELSRRRAGGEPGTVPTPSQGEPGTVPTPSRGEPETVLKLIPVVVSCTRPQAAHRTRQTATPVAETVRPPSEVI